MKSLAADVIRSFKCLSGFKHQNPSMQKRPSMIFQIHFPASLISREKTNVKINHTATYTHTKISELPLQKSKERKDIIEDLREKIKDNLQLISERTENKTLLESVGVKEAHLNHQRQLGRISATEVYSMLSEFKRKVDLETYKNDQIFKSVPTRSKRTKQASDFSKTSWSVSTSTACFFESSLQRAFSNSFAPRKKSSSREKHLVLHQPSHEFEGTDTRFGVRQVLRRRRHQVRKGVHGAA